MLLTGFAVGLGIIGAVESTWTLLVLLAVLGVLNCYVTIVLMSAIQNRPPKEILGRTMGLFIGAATLTALMTIRAIRQPALALISMGNARTADREIVVSTARIASLSQ